MFSGRFYYLLPQTVSIGIIVAILVAAVLSFQSEDGIFAKRLGGDFVAFYSAGKILNTDNPEELYSARVQANMQKDLARDLDGKSVQYFAYPAFFAIPFAFLANLSFPTAYFLYIVLLSVVVYFSSSIITQIAQMQDHKSFVTYAIFSYPFLAVSVIGGQNTALSICLVCMIVNAVRRHREGEAGIQLALLSFKPPVFLFFLMLFLYQKKIKALATMIVTLSALYLLGGIYSGFLWPVFWIESLQFFSQQETLANFSRYASLMSFAGTLYQISLPLLITYVLVVVIPPLVLAVSILPRLNQLQQFGLVCMLLPILSPHMLYYDLGILIVGWLIAVSKFTCSEQLKRYSIYIWIGAFLAYIFSYYIGSIAYLVYGASPLILFHFVIANQQIKSHHSKNEDDKEW